MKIMFTVERLLGILRTSSLKWLQTLINNKIPLGLENKSVEIGMRC